MRRPQLHCDEEPLADADYQCEQDPLAAAQALIHAWEGSADEALLAACEEGLGVDAVCYIVKELGADDNSQNESGKTALHIAARFDDTHDVMRTLVKELGADVNARDNKLDTPLHDAARLRRTEAMRVLVAELGADVAELGANINAHFGTTALHIASGNGHCAFVRMLVKDLGGRPVRSDATAARRGKGSYRHRLVVGGFWVGAANFLGVAPFGQAHRSGHRETANVLSSEMASER